MKIFYRTSEFWLSVSALGYFSYLREWVSLVVVYLAYGLSRAFAKRFSFATHTLTSELFLLFPLLGWTLYCRAFIPTAVLLAGYTLSRGLVKTRPNQSRVQMLNV